MVDYDNRDYITTLDASNSNHTKGIVDGDDHVHSGIIKALELAAKDTCVVDYGSSVFQQVAGSSRTKFQFSGDIKFMREGRVYVATPAAEELKSNPDTTNDRYDMLVINNSNALEIREGTAASTPRVVDALTAGDIPVALIRVVAGSGNNVANREIQLYGYNRGVLATSLAKVYNNAGGEIIDITSTDVSLWGSSAIGSFTLDRSEAGKEILTVKNAGGAKAAVIEGTGGTNTQPVLDVKYGGASMTSVSGQGNMTVANDVTLTAGNLQVGGNVIKASDGGSTITMDTDDNVTIAGDLTVAGGDIIGAQDADLTVKADGDLILQVDADNTTTQKWQFKTGAGGNAAEIYETGSMLLVGDLNIQGGNLITTAVTADERFTGGKGLTNASEHDLRNQGWKTEAFGSNFGLKAANAPISGSDLGQIQKCIQPLLTDALNINNVITPEYEVIYLGLNDVNQIAEQDAATAGLALNEYQAFIEGIEAPASNGLFGGGGFVAIAAPDISNRSSQKFTLVNISNVPCYVVSTANNTNVLQVFHKGLKTVTHTKTFIGHNTVNLSRQMETSVFNGINGSGYNIPSTSGTAYLLKPGCSVTLHAIQLSGEEGPTYEVQQFHGFSPAPPNAYWMVKSSSEGTLEAKIINNTHIKQLHLGAPYSGYTVYANFTASAQTIYLPPVPAFGTQFFIYALADVTVVAANTLAIGYIDTGGSTSNDVIRDSGSDVNTKTLSTGSMATFIYGPDNKWLLVG